MEIGRARKQEGQGKEKERQPARQGNKAVGEKDRWIILILHGGKFYEFFSHTITKFYHYTFNKKVLSHIL